MLDACMIIFLSFNFDPFGEPTSNDYVVLRSLLNCDFTTILPYACLDGGGKEEEWREVE